MLIGLFPDHGAAEDNLYAAELVLATDRAVFVLDRGHGLLGGFINVGSRLYAEGCETSPVGYIEEWFVDADLRRSGVGRKLMQAAEEWCRAQGYLELASDTEMLNLLSQAVHVRLGFKRIEEIVCFMKPVARTHRAARVRCPR